MDRKTIITKTGKGMREASGTIRTLPRDLHELLSRIDGRSSIEDLATRHAGPTAVEVETHLARLAAEGYIRELPVSAGDPQSRTTAGGDGADLDFTSQAWLTAAKQAEQMRRDEEQARLKAEATARRWAEMRTARRIAAQAKREAEELAKREAAKRAQREVEAKARREAEERARREAERAQREAEERAKRAAEERARLEAAERAQREAEDRARREAEERARREAAERAQRETKERAKRAAEERARLEAAERAQREAEDRARREAEERARREAAERAQREAEERAKREAEERVRLEAAERAQREAEDRARREAEERARREAAERAQREAEERAKHEAEKRARLEAAERVQREAEDRARREAEERARLEAAERAQREAEDRARREAEAQARLEAAERARREAEDRARREADEQARREAAQRAQREAEERAERKAEEREQREAAKRAKREAKSRAKREAKELAQRKAAERARRKAEDSAPVLRVYRRRRVKPGRLAAGVLACLVLCLVLLHALPFDWRIPSLERAAAAQLGQPVKIRSVHLSLVPQPHWRLAGIVIGDQRQIRIPAVRMMAGVGSLFSDHPAFTAVELDAPRVDAETMAWLLFGKPDARGLVNIHVDARNVVLDSGSLSLPKFDVSTDIGADGQWRTIVANSTDRAIAVELHADGNRVQVVAGGNSLALPFSAAPQLADWRVTGSATRSGLGLTTFEGRLLGGRLDGHASLTWNAAMRIEGELHATRIDAAQLYPGLFAAGLLDVTAAFALPLQQADKQTAAPRLAGRFSIQRGTLGNVDLGSVLKNLGAGGITRFAKLDGSFVHAVGRTQLRDLHLDAGAMSASGYADVDADQNIQGAATITLALPGERRRASLALAGTFSPPYGRNVRWLRH